MKIDDAIVVQRTAINLSNIEIHESHASFDPENITLTIVSENKKTKFKLDLYRLLRAGLIDIEVEECVK